MAMNLGSQELAQFVDTESGSEPECASQPEVAQSSRVRALFAKKYGKVLLVVAALALVALAAGRAARAPPHWTAAPNKAVKLQTPTIIGSIEEFGQRLSAFTVGKPWSSICSGTYGVICTAHTTNSHPTDPELQALLTYYDTHKQYEAMIDQMILTSMNAAGQTCPGVNEGTTCGATTTT